jgi:hypothetical protein
VIFDAKGLSIATVDPDDRVALRPVTVARDLGAVIEIAAGLGPKDRVIQNPPDGIGNGDAVHVLDVPAPSAVAGAQARPKGDHG